jgi:16S rRNA A1518/A1519 N6-dimethyltransferase RsmA/KsgA/DIM1 with predicted DNA glycosylase/AP lyase activity
MGDKEHTLQIRRKIIYSALRRNYEGCDAEWMLSACDVRKTDRPENIDPITFMKMSELLRAN